MELVWQKAALCTKVHQLPKNLHADSHNETSNNNGHNKLTEQPSSQDITNGPHVGVLMEQQLGCWIFDQVIVGSIPGT